MERIFLAATGFNTGLVQFLLPYCVIIINMHITDALSAQSPTCTGMHLHWFCMHKILFMNNHNL